MLNINANSYEAAVVSSSATIGGSDFCAEKVSFAKLQARINVTSLLINTQMILSWLRAYKYVMSISALGVGDKNYLLDQMLNFQHQLELLRKKITSELSSFARTGDVTFTEFLIRVNKFCHDGIMALGKADIKALGVAVDNCTYVLNDLVLALNVAAHKHLKRRLK